MYGQGRCSDKLGGSPGYVQFRSFPDRGSRSSSQSSERSRTADDHLWCSYSPWTLCGRSCFPGVVRWRYSDGTRGCLFYKQKQWLPPSYCHCHDHYRGNNFQDEHWCKHDRADHRSWSSCWHHGTNSRLSCRRNRCNF